MGSPEFFGRMNSAQGANSIEGVREAILSEYTGEISGKKLKMFSLAEKG